MSDTDEQQQWLDFRMANVFVKPHRPTKPIEISYKWIEAEREGK